MPVSQANEPFEPYSKHAAEEDRATKRQEPQLSVNGAGTLSYYHQTHQTVGTSEKRQLNTMEEDGATNRQESELPINGAGTMSYHQSDTSDN